MGTQHLTPDQKRTVLDVYSQTLSVAETARRTGHRPSRVRTLLKRNRVPLSGSKGGACYRRIDDVRRWAGEGVSLSEIARRIGTNHHRVSDFVRLHGIQIVRRPQAGSNNPAWSGGRVVDKCGYHLLHMPDHPDANSHGYVREHRLVMERKLGRRLTADEVVHHQDGDKSNNHPDNLELFPSNADHLAETLKGKCPKWTEEGRRAILEACRRPRGPRRKPIPPASTPGADPSQETTGPTAS